MIAWSVKKWVDGKAGPGPVTRGRIESDDGAYHAFATRFTEYMSVGGRWNLVKSIRVAPATTDSEDGTGSSIWPDDMFLPNIRDHFLKDQLRQPPMEEDECE